MGLKEEITVRSDAILQAGSPFFLHWHFRRLYAAISVRVHSFGEKPLSATGGLRPESGYSVPPTNLRDRAPVISNHRPCGVSTALIRTRLQSAQFRTAPIGAACKSKEPTLATQSHATHRIFASVTSGAKIFWRRVALIFPSSMRSVMLFMALILQMGRIVRFLFRKGRSQVPPTHSKCFRRVRLDRIYKSRGIVMTGSNFSRESSCRFVLDGPSNPAFARGSARGQCVDFHCDSSSSPARLDR